MSRHVVTQSDKDFHGFSSVLARYSRHARDVEKGASPEARPHVSAIAETSAAEQRARADQGRICPARERHEVKPAAPALAKPEPS